MNGKLRVLSCLEAASGPVTDRALLAVMARRFSGGNQKALAATVSKLNAGGAGIRRISRFGYVLSRPAMEAAE